MHPTDVSRRHALPLITALGLVATGALPASAGPAGASAVDPSGRANAQMRRVLVALQELGARPVSELTVAQARRQPTFADAVMRVVRQRSGKPFRPLPVEEIRDIKIEGAAGPLTARLYDPKKRHGAAPLIVYFHGGGWVIANRIVYDASTRALADGTGAIVLSVDYRLGPENRFPAAHDDAVAAYRWALGNARRLGADPRRIALVGESAGGNLAIDTAIAARNQGLREPVHQLLVYPVAGTDTTTFSYRQDRDAKPLSRADILFFVENYTRRPADLRDPRLDVVGRARLGGLPPTTIVSADIDPLRSEGFMLAERLREAGVPVERRLYLDVTHEFFGMYAVVDEAEEAQRFVARRLNEAFA